MKEIKCIIRGNVQGVLYRDFVRSSASKFGLTGTVENMSDGSVEVFAQGHINALEELLAQLHIGTEHSEIREVIVENREIHDPMIRFTIL